MRLASLTLMCFAAAALSPMLAAPAASQAATAPAPAPSPDWRSVDCTGAAPMAQFTKFNGTALTFPEVVVPGVTITIVGLKVVSDVTDLTVVHDPCAKLELTKSYHVQLRAAAKNFSASNLIVFNASLRCGLFGQDPDAGNVPNAKLATMTFKFAFNDVHDGEYGLSPPFTGDPLDPNGRVTFSDSSTSYFVSGAHLDKCRVLINV